MTVADYVSGERFFNCADTIWAMGHPTPPPGSVAVATHQVNDLFRSLVAGRLPHGSITLISHNSDRPATPERFDQKPPCVGRWFSQNANDPRITALPIGLVNHHTPRGDWSVIDAVRKAPPVRDALALCLFTTKTNDVRGEVLERFGKRKWVTVQGGKSHSDLPYADYITELARHRFVFSPPGAGVDCHRHWEALAVGTVPIVLRSPELAQFEAAGVPFLWVDSYADVTLGKLRTMETPPDLWEWTQMGRWQFDGALVPRARKVVAFSLFGRNELYRTGVEQNLTAMAEHYPGWEAWVYHGNGVRDIDSLQRKGCRLWHISDPAPGRKGAFWRFAAGAAPDVECVIFRDADSRVNCREAAAVREWMDEGQALHCMHDHRHHRIYPIMAGMWGLRGGALPDAHTLIEGWGDYSTVACDQDFLKATVWPRFKKDCLRHSGNAECSERWEARKFPIHAPFDSHVGAIVQIKKEPPPPPPARTLSRTPSGTPPPPPEPVVTTSVIGMVKRVKRKILCPKCGGAGRVGPSRLKLCPMCETGSGFVVTVRDEPLYAAPIPDAPIAPDVIPHPTSSFMVEVDRMQAAEVDAIRGALVNARHKRYVDIGAADGIKGSPVWWAVQAGWEGVSVEPSAAGFLSLQQNYAAYPKAHLLNAALVVDHPGVIRFWAHTGNPRWSTTSSGRASTSPVKDGYRERFAMGLTFADLFRQWPGPVDLVNIDVEGNNLPVFVALLEYGVAPAVIVVEHQAEPTESFKAAAFARGYMLIHENRENLTFQMG